MCGNSVRERGTVQPVTFITLSASWGASESESKLGVCRESYQVTGRGRDGRKGGGQGVSWACGEGRVRKE